MDRICSRSQGLDSIQFSDFRIGRSAGGLVQCQQLRGCSTVQVTAGKERADPRANFRFTSQTTFVPSPMVMSSG